MSEKDWPFVSILIPTYNAEKHIGRCLASLDKQTYPKNRYEVIVADGDSADKTVEITKKYGYEVVTNPHRLAERGKAVALKHAKGQIIGLVDADNEIVQSDWLEKLVYVLEQEPDLIGVESNWILRPNDPVANRYCCLIRQEDPVSRQIVLLSRCATPIDKRDYSVWIVDEGNYPLLGANGFLWRREILDLIGPISSFDEADFGAQAFEMGMNRVGNVKGYGIYHYHVETVRAFFSKRYRQSQLFFERKTRKSRAWLDRYSRLRVFEAVLYCISIVGPAIEALKGYRESGDAAWFLHPFMAFATVLIYSFTFMKLYVQQVVSRWLTLVDQGNEYTTRHLSYKSAIEDNQQPGIGHKLVLKLASDYMKGKKCLDVGCWTGKFLSLQTDLTNTQFGVDIDIFPLLAAKKRNPQASFIQAVVQSLPFKNDSFEVVTLLEVIEHLPSGSELQIVEEIKRVLRPSSMLLLTTPHHHWFANLSDIAYWLAGHRHYHERDIHKMLTRTGFEIVKCEISGRYFNAISSGILAPLLKWVFHTDISSVGPIVRLREKDYRNKDGFAHLRVLAKTV